MKQRYGTKWFVHGQVYRQKNILKTTVWDTSKGPKGPDLREAVMGMERQGQIKKRKTNWKKN